jgi:ELP3 family radical SAM enzyme/protein acetyltransferase
MIHPKFTSRSSWVAPTEIPLKLRPFIEEINTTKFDNFEHFNLTLSQLCSKYRIKVGKFELKEYIKLLPNPSKEVLAYAVNNTSKSHSGVCVIAIMTAPDHYFGPGKFSCKSNCSFCPAGTKTPRSYPAEEPVPLRALQNDFCPIRQMHSRFMQLAGHTTMPDKLEVLILGGTWSSYPVDYVAKFHNEILYAANLWALHFNACETHRKLKETPDIEDYNKTWRDLAPRPMLSFAKEAELNRKSLCRVIGITVETRPDVITLEELRRMRNLGTTRIQMGFQHTNNTILRKNKRGCTIEESAAGLKLALNSGFKVDAHWMLDLPHSTHEDDELMIRKVLSSVTLQADQIKWYPCNVLEGAEIHKHYLSGKYKPRAEIEPYSIVELVKLAKELTPPWVRTNRVVRDFPMKIILGGTKLTHMHDIVLKQLKEEGKRCLCIRCREVKRTAYIEEPTIVCREYRSSNGIEYFISSELADKTLLGFCRLRLPVGKYHITKYPIEQLEELQHCALIRELHVYGDVTTQLEKIKTHSAQHRGIGKLLLKNAEYLAKYNGYPAIAVISGIGVQDYYKALNYEDGLFMKKLLL